MIPLVASESTDSVARFEDAIAAHHGAAGAVATNSGTSALHLALMALGVGPGDEVIIPSYTCVAVLNAVRLAGAREVLVDNEYDPEHMNFNGRWTPHNNKVVMPFMFGVPPLVKWGWGIEDRAMALGCASPIFGDVAVHSFHASKIISTGEGGMVVARTPETLARLRDMNGYSDAVVADRLNEAPEYTPRVNYRMSARQASSGCMDFCDLDLYFKRRAKIAAHYIDRLNLNITLPEGSVWGRFVFELPESMTPPDFVRAMADRGVEAGRGVAPPLHRYLRLPGWEHSNAEKAYQRLGSLPIWPGLTDLQVEQVADAAKAVLGR